MKFKILTIDDSRLIRNMVKQAFVGYDCVIFEGENGELGLKTALRIRPDLIFLDIDMPVMNGWDTLACIRYSDEIATTPVIMFTANAQEKNVERAEKLKVADFIAKPIQPNELIAYAKKIIDL